MALFGDSLCNGPMLNPCSQKATYKVMDKQRTNNNLLSWNGRQNLDSSWQTQLATNVGQSTSLQLISTEAAHAVLLGKANTKRSSEVMVEQTLKTNPVFIVCWSEWCSTKENAFMVVFASHGQDVCCMDINLWQNHIRVNIQYNSLIV